MYKLFFNSEEVYRNLSLEETLAFALSLHRSSNVDHTIGVVYPDGEVHVTLKYEVAEKTSQKKS